ncbi:MAG: hypothetical protein U0234_11560 [Sandaracinus sp.]
MTRISRTQDDGAMLAAARRMRAGTARSERGDALLVGHLGSPLARGIAVSGQVAAGSTEAEARAAVDAEIAECAKAGTPPLVTIWVSWEIAATFVGRAAVSEMRPRARKLPESHSPTVLIRADGVALVEVDYAAAAPKIVPPPRV